MNEEGEKREGTTKGKEGWREEEEGRKEKKKGGKERMRKMEKDGKERKE